MWKNAKNAILRLYQATRRSAHLLPRIFSVEASSTPGSLQIPSGLLDSSCMSIIHRLLGAASLGGPQALGRRLPSFLPEKG